MKLTLVLNESIFDCKIKISDLQGERYYYISAVCEDGMTSSSTTVDVFGSDFCLSVIPIVADTKSVLNISLQDNWKDKLAKNFSKFLLSTIEYTVLRVGCDYNITGAVDSDSLDITLQSYFFGPSDRYNILGLIPMNYMFFEVANFNNYYKLTDAYETNRKDVLKFSKTYAFSEILSNGLFATLITYPIQVRRIKRLTKNRKIRKTLTKFNSFTPAKRQRFLEKQEKFFD